MKALVFDGKQLSLVKDHPAPARRNGWAVIRVHLAGICRTDQEIVHGYMGFRGVLGHEFVGTVARCADATWVGKRVVGEINAACGECDACARGLDRHCPNRSVLGIAGLDGCMAEYCSLPVANLREVPDDIDDDHAVFTEPLSAAFAILEQVAIDPADRCVVLGDGKLGILCAWVLATVSRHVTLVGEHPDKLALAPWGGIATSQDTHAERADADVVVEATGSPDGLRDAIARCRPRGTIALKSTIAHAVPIDLAPVVVNEIRVVGSRCGRFAQGLAGLGEHAFPVERLISARFPLERAAEGFRAAADPRALKVLLDIS
jgi:alcohol dehydrogenase